MPIEVVALYCYPVKSLAGGPVQGAEFGPRGIRHDRRWMIVDETGKFLSQRSTPSMCFLSATTTDSELRIQDRAGDCIVVDLAPTENRLAVRVWDDTVEAAPVALADEWLSDHLAKHVRLVYMPEDASRFAPGSSNQDPISFADGFPALVAGEGSLEALNERLGEPIGMNRFRPNIVVRGSAPFAEDEWRRIQIGDIPFHFCRRCARCNLTTIDPETARSGPEPLRTLAKFRLINQKACFGAYFGPEAAGTIEVGMLLLSG